MEKSRRSFIKKSALGFAGITIAGMGMSSKSYARIIGSNERLNIAIIGLGRRLGAYFEPIALPKSNVQLVYLCDVMKSQRIRAVSSFSKHINYQPKIENDLRKVMEDEKVDAIINATPDHWHAPGAFLAVKAGKHVYVEKPGSHNAGEGALYADFVKKYNRIIQLGNQQRSSVESKEIVDEIHNGVIGIPYKAVAFYSNNRGEVPVAVNAPIPEGLDWDLFQGPAPRREYRFDTWDYNWHWYEWDYGTAEMGNNAIHELDIARWALKVNYPERVSVEAEKRHFINDGWTMYDTMLATYQFQGNIIIQWDGKSRNGYNTYGSDRGTVIYGSDGTAFINRDGYKLYDRNGKFLKSRSNSGGESGTTLGGGGDMTTAHLINFFDAIRGKVKPNSPMEEMAKSTHLCHLANISYRLKKDIEVNALNGKVQNREANKFWGRVYEPGWEPKL